MRHKHDYNSTVITTDVLIHYGMRAELAGCINRIIYMNPLTIDDLVRIGEQENYRIE
jgi:ATP-dependent Clp protease ATP-binding subunit ClpX